ncbi:transcription termination factor 2 [Parasteatoda tepidariorum]|uniref:transcription termination factor 2 n=1 Tax=Parasteatoda tepidariorum TaxID=114398 RepID=UPI00077FDB96|nr:transcription termination factor 2-like [Parasteatoda tepidariorum]
MQNCSIDRFVLKPSQLNTEISKVKAAIERQKKVYNSVTLSLLPDKGAKLKHKINDLENLLKDLTISAVECSKSSLSETVSSNVVNNKELKSNSLSTIKDGKINSVFSTREPKTISSPTKAVKEQKAVSVSSITVKEVKSKSDSSAKWISVSSTCDSGFQDGDSDDTLTILKSSTAEKFTSFHELSKKIEKSYPDPLKEVVKSPAFRNYRKTDEIPKTKLTEAKPLFEKENLKKSSHSAYSVNHVTCLANEETIKQLHGSLAIFPNDCEDEKQPRHLLVPLMKHQIKALSWLMWRETQTPSGGVLADDMGLGKTLSMIALILKQREKYLKAVPKKLDDDVTKGTLVVCLASIIRQWEAEIKKYCKKDSVNVLVYHGAQRSRDVRYMRNFDVVVTTYQILLSESKSKESGLFQLEWERIVLDEAHTIKNHSSKTAAAVFSLRGLKKWCVTGTPIHNDFKDLYSLVKFLQFHPFDDYKKFKKLTDDKTEDYSERRNMLVKSMLLRRTKSEVDDSGKPLVKMVKKSILTKYIELSPEERKVYDELHKKVTDVIMRRVCDSSSKKFNNTSSLLVLLLRVQQCCCHVSLLNQEAEESVDDSLNDISNALTSLSISSSPSPDSSFNSNLDLTFSEYESHSINDKSVMSSKLLKLFEELDKIAEESNNSAKSVIVSQWVSMLKLVELHLKKKNKIYHMIAGNTKSEERQKMSEDFNFNSDSPKILLLSLKAGGVGLNLVGANHLFLLDLHWNPALEMQACDRIHRVGQKNEVFIHKFVCKNTIEEKILTLQNTKSNMASSALNNAGKIKKGISIDDLKMLFNIKF